MYTSILSGDLMYEDPVVEVSVNGNPGDKVFEVKRHYLIQMIILEFQ